MHKLSTITDNPHMTTRHALGTEDQNVPCLNQHERITSIALKPDFLDLGSGSSGIGVEINAPTLPIEIPQEVPTVIVLIPTPKDGIDQREDVRNSNTTAHMLYSCVEWHRVRNRGRVHRLPATSPNDAL